MLLLLLFGQSLCLTLCDPMDYSKPCFPVLHHFPDEAIARGVVKELDMTEQLNNNNKYVQ